MQSATELNHSLVASIEHLLGRSLFLFSSVLLYSIGVDKSIALAMWPKYCILVSLLYPEIVFPRLILQ